MAAKKKEVLAKPKNGIDGKFQKGVVTNPDGAPCLLTKAIQEAICSRIAAGSFFSDACVLSKVKVKTGQSWMARGAKGEAPYDVFFEAVQEADAQCKAWGTGLIMAAAESDSKNYPAIFKLFALKYPKEWRETKDVEISGKHGGAPVEVSLSELVTALAVGKKNAEPSDDDSSGDD